MKLRPTVHEVAGVVSCICYSEVIQSIIFLPLLLRNMIMYVISNM